MGSQSDFQYVEGRDFRDHQEVFDYADDLRQIIGYGAELVALDHSYLKAKYTRYIERHMHLYQAGRGGDRGGFMGFFEKDAAGIAREIVRPFEVAAANLQQAQLAVVKFKPVFYKWTEPIRNPRHSSGRGDDFGDGYPG